MTPAKSPTAPSQFLLINGGLLFVVGAYLDVPRPRGLRPSRGAERHRGGRVPAAASYLGTLMPAISLAGDGQISPLATTLLAVSAILWAGGYGTLGIVVLVGGIVAGLAVYRRSRVRRCSSAASRWRRSGRWRCPTWLPSRATSGG